MQVVWSISSHFVEIQCWNVRCIQKLQKIQIVQGHNVDKSKKSVTSACYDKQHVCTYLQPFSHYTSQ